jgi:hypothetical protein
MGSVLLCSGYLTSLPTELRASRATRRRSQRDGLGQICPCHRGSLRVQICHDPRWWRFLACRSSVRRQPISDQQLRPTGVGRGHDAPRPVMVDVSLRTSLVSSIIGAAALSKLLSKSPHAPPILDKLMNAHVLNRLGSLLLLTIEQAMQASRKSRLSAEELLR